MDESLKLKLIKGTPILLQESNCFLYHRTVGEIINFGYSSFNSIVHLFTLSDEELYKFLAIPKLTVYTFFLSCFIQPNIYTEELRKGFQFFLNASEIAVDLEKEIFLLSIGEIERIEFGESSFNELSRQIGVMYNGESASSEEEDRRLNEQERKMKEKFRKLREAREKAKSRTEHSAISFSDLIGGFIVRNTSLSFEETMNLPYYTFFFLLKKLENYDNYDWQLRAILAGAKNDKEIHHWLENTDDEY